MLNNKQTYQYNFLKSNPILDGAGPWDTGFFKSNFDFALKHYEKFTILCKQEVIGDIEYLENLQNIIRKNSNKEIYISCSTTSNYEYSLDPLLNIVFWRDTYSRNKISWESSSGDFPIFDKKHYKDIIKNNSFILSVRKERPERDFIFRQFKGSLLPNNYNGILRYAGWPEQGFEDLEWELKNKNNFPTFIEIIEEYKKSYISFIIESQASSIMTQFSEKTLLPFLTKSLPIIIGGPSIIKELSEMGFYIFSDNFNIKDSGWEKTNLIHFAKSVEEINGMDMKSIEKLYKNNIDKIEHNYKLATYLLWEKSLIGHEKFDLNLI